MAQSAKPKTAKKPAVKAAAKKSIAAPAAKKVAPAKKTAPAPKVTAKPVAKVAAKKLTVKDAVKPANKVVKKVDAKPTVPDRKTGKPEKVMAKTKEKKPVKPAIKKVTEVKETIKTQAVKKVEKPVPIQSAPVAPAPVVTAPAPPPIPADRPRKYGKEDLEHFKNIILSRIDETRVQIQNLRDQVLDPTTGEYINENSPYSLHMADTGTDAMEREKTSLFIQRETKFLGYLEDSLKRIDNGTYGICIECSEEPKNLCPTCPLIDKKRLEAVPHSQLCMPIKLRQEKPRK